MQITVLDYGMGNIGSIVNMVRYIGHDIVVASSAEEITQAKKLVLPGVGSFDRGMKRLNENGMAAALNRKVLDDKIPILGLCLGLQLMTRGSEEGSMPGLAWLDADVVKFNPAVASEKIRVPHMGWNTVSVNTENPVLPLNESQRFYFVHAYHLGNLPVGQTLCTTHYGYNFASGAIARNIYGVQFHPEKSHRFGMRLLKNFIERV
jgi:imidazole glycerol-phosphate synthase subunit HisH